MLTHYSSIILICWLSVEVVVGLPQYFHDDLYGNNNIASEDAIYNTNVVRHKMFSEDDKEQRLDMVDHDSGGYYNNNNDNVVPMEKQTIVPPVPDPTKDTGHHPGGLPMISDSAFSLVTLLYVSIAFLFVFFMFCWRSSSQDETGEAGNKPVCLLTSLEGTFDDIIRRRSDSKKGSQSSLSDEYSESGIIRQPTIIPATPTPPISILPAVDEEEDDDETSSLTGGKSSPEK